MNTQALKLNPVRTLYGEFQKIDPRIPVLVILIGYLVLGFTVLGFNRTPTQAIITSLSTCLLEAIYTRIFKKVWAFPLSALITSCSLSILLNYSHNYWMLLVPVYFAISTKYFFTFKGRHVFNPAQIAVTMSLIFAGELITAAPAYQWNGIENMSVFIGMLGIFFLLPKINRHYLVLSFLITFTAQTFLRAMIMKHHLPFETLFLGTLSSPAFFLFTFFMITDPATSPSSKKLQIIFGFLIATIDLIYHLRQSYFTFFFAGATVQFGRLIFEHARALKAEGSLKRYIHKSLILSGHWKKMSLVVLIGLMGVLSYQYIIKPKVELSHIHLQFEKSTPISVEMGKTLERVDPRVQHLAKWLLSVGDSVAISDIDGDGLEDLYFSFPLKNDQYRNALYLNKGDAGFERFPLPLKEVSANIEKYGLASHGTFVDYDNDGDQDLFISYAFGAPHFLINQLSETGKLDFIDKSKELGLPEYTNSIIANFFDFNKDGLLDLIVGNVWPEYLPDYSEKTRLNLFNLPQPKYEGDERMFNFMHASWHMADNGGVNRLYLQNKNHTFEELDSKVINMPEHRWTLAIGTADFNQDGWTDIYMANDFGKDDYYLNQKGKSFKRIVGDTFGDIGLDTYKGMNATIADFDNNLTSDVYISNVHHAYQAEGSLLWSFEKNEQGELEPVERATYFNALNENRFGWGAAAGDLDLNGYIDLVQANGMVDDSIDKKFDECPNYWYVNEKIARSAPSYHRYVNKWGDIRGFCIYGKERNRVYLNSIGSTQFVDVAEHVGVTDLTNSRGVAMADLNNDGKLDFVITHMFKEPSFYTNKMSSKANYLMLDIESKHETCNREAIGSIITITYNGQKQMREKVVVNGFNAQSSKKIHFGLGDYQGDVKVEINWCGSDRKQYTLGANKLHKVIY
jgi:Na+-translocating ferredoxin:NAD+ oxidoreductase RnfD subunit